MFYIYEIKNLVNNKTYIGQHQYEQDINEDVYFGSGTILKKAIDKYGIGNFRKNILISNIDTIDQCNFYEIVCICYAKIFGKAEYNIALGGGGVHLSEEMIDIVNDKIKKTKLEKYGSENYCNVNKSRATKLLKYGDENYVNLEKAKLTNLIKYGVDNIFKDSNYLKSKYIEKLGVDNPSQLDEVKNKKSETCLKNFGETSHMKTEKYRKQFSITQKKYKQENITIGFIDCTKTYNRQDFLDNKIQINEEYDINLTFVSNKNENIQKIIGKKFVSEFIKNNPYWKNCKLTTKEIDQDFINKVVALRDQNFSFVEIGSKLKIRGKTIKKILEENNYNRNIKLKVLNQEEKDRILELRKTMPNIRDLAMKAHIKYSTVKEFLESVEPPKIKKEYDNQLLKELYLSGKALYNICNSQNIGRFVLIKILKTEGVFNE